MKVPLPWLTPNNVEIKLFLDGANSRRFSRMLVWTNPGIAKPYSCVLRQVSGFNFLNKIKFGSKKKVSA